MWKRSYVVITKEATREQMWKLIADIDHWHTWDDTVAYSKLLGELKEGNYFLLKPKGGPRVKIKLLNIIAPSRFTDCTIFPLARMIGDHLFEDTAEGLKITVTMAVKGLLAFLWIRLVAKDIVDHLPRDIQNQINHAKKIKI